MPAVWRLIVSSPPAEIGRSAPWCSSEGAKREANAPWAVWMRLPRPDSGGRGRPPQAAARRPALSS